MGVDLASGNHRMRIYRPRRGRTRVLRRRGVFPLGRLFYISRLESSSRMAAEEGTEVVMAVEFPKVKNIEATIRDNRLGALVARTRELVQ